MPDSQTHLLAPVHHTVSRLAQGAPVVSDPSDTDATWYPGTWLADPDGPTLAGLLKYVTHTWGGQPHVAAALAFKGYAYAAALPVVAGWLGHGVVPVLDSAALRVGLSDRLPYVRLDIAGVRTVSALGAAGSAPDAGLARVQLTPTQGAGAAALADAARSSLLHGHLAEIVEAFAVKTRVGRRLLWGSLAESVAYIAMQLHGADSARRALAVLGEPVAGLVEIADGPGAPVISRRTCCLWFASDTGDGQYCASCPVTP